MECWQIASGNAQKASIPLAKDEQEKHEAAEASSAPGKMSRKEFEKELAKLQVELVRSQLLALTVISGVIFVVSGLRFRRTLVASQ